MISVRPFANRLTRAVNPNITVTLKRSTGYTIGANGAQVPTYAADETITVQMQALTQSEIQHLDKLNISNGQASVYADTQLSSVDRPSSSGGDVIQFGTDVQTPAPLRGQTWLVVALLEGWAGSGWCKVAVTSQMADPEA